jgi:hypothetical protein
MLTAAYYMLRDDQDYHDLGAAHFQRGDHDRLVAGLTRRLHHTTSATRSPAAPPPDAAYGVGYLVAIWQVISTADSRFVASYQGRHLGPRGELNRNDHREACLQPCADDLTDPNERRAGGGRP